MAAAQLERLRAELMQGHPLRRTHVRLDVSGEMTASDWRAFESFVEEMSGECASFDVRGVEDVGLVVIPEDIERSGCARLCAGGRRSFGRAIQESRSFQN